MNSTGKKTYKVRLVKDERKRLKEIPDSGKGPNWGHFDERI